MGNPSVMKRVTKGFTDNAPTALATGVAVSSAAATAALVAAQAAAAAATNAAQIANVAFMLQNTMNGMLMENFGAVMETLMKTSKLGAKTLTKSVPDPA